MSRFTDTVDACISRFTYTVDACITLTNAVIFSLALMPFAWWDAVDEHGLVLGTLHTPLSFPIVFLGVRITQEINREEQWPLRERARDIEEKHGIGEGQ